MRPNHIRRLVVPGVLLALFAAGATAAPAEPTDNPWFQSLSWRNIGPARGGRAQTVSGVIGDRNTYYMGATGGGVWKTTNAGRSWDNISDGFFKTGSVGAIAVAPTDANVIYVGMGEADVRGNFSSGDGVYKSLDAGKTWSNIGLADTQQIGDVQVDPNNPDVVFVAALGHVFGANAQRGVFKSTDGGATWRNVLFVDDHTGAIDLAIDPFNARVMYAAMWQIRRTPWSLDSGGLGSGLYRSTDAGETWTELTEGLPKGVKGKIGVSASAAQRDLVYAIIEADHGGVFKSTDAGESWTRVNKERKLRQRAWYYTHIEADPIDADTVYVLNVRFHKSIDGGKTWKAIRVPHGDNHDLWIDPIDHDRMIESNDGGAIVSTDAGETWTDEAGQPTAQFYHVTVDNGLPYRVYGSQQDNSSASISSKASARNDWRRDLYAVGGGESGYLAVDPVNANIVYGGSYGGLVTRYDHALQKTRNITPWPDNPMGSGDDVLKHRFQWTFPIVLSPHDSNTVYVGGESLFRSRDGGASWQIISPDLTTNDKTKQRSSGGPITQDNTSVEYYCTIFTVAESPVKKGVIWVGSDDGLVHVTRDGGRSWEDVTPPDMGDWPMISMIEASPFDASAAYLAVNRYKMDDNTPYVYRTHDGGKTWKLTADGIDSDAFVRSVREDPVRKGLLYAATETGVYVSFHEGGDWQPLQLNLPATPVTDLVVKDDDLVISTQGRSFWILDDLSVLRQFEHDMKTDEARLFAPAPAYRQRWDSVRVSFNLPETIDENTALVFVNGKGDVMRSYAIRLKNERNGKTADSAEASADREKKDTIDAKPGMNRFDWNMRIKDPVRVPGAVAWPPHPPGPRVAPGAYTVELRLGETTLSDPVTILGDPRVDTTAAQYADQFDLLMDIQETLSEAHRAVNTIRDIRKQINHTMAQAKDAGAGESLQEASEALLKKLSDIEEVIIQTRSKSRQDPLNFPIKLNDKIGALAYTVDGDYPTTQQAHDVFARLSKSLQVQLAALDAVVNGDVSEFNRLVERQSVPAIVLPTDGKD